MKKQAKPVLQERTNSPRYMTTLALSKHDDDRKKELTKKGIKIVDIFRAGLDKCEKDVKQL